MWDWLDDRSYVVHLYITQHMPGGEWLTNHFVGQYRAITTSEVAEQIERSGFCKVKVLQPAETGFYQPIVTALCP